VRIFGLEIMKRNMTSASTAGKPYYRLDMDTSTCAKSYEAALWAGGGLLELVKAVMEKRLDNGFALVRPPGHHAEQDRAWDFAFSTTLRSAPDMPRNPLG
jgi:acetoin utilization deacetylase AcuC-like enzyme